LNAFRREWNIPNATLTTKLLQGSTPTDQRAKIGQLGQPHDKGV